MRKGFFSVIILLALAFIFAGCIRNTPYVTTTNPSMTASIGTYNYVAATTVTSIVDTQNLDTTIALVITGNSGDMAHPYDKIELNVNRYKGQLGVYSIVQSQAGAVLIHSGTWSVAAGGVVAITQITDNTISGYFSFDTYDNIHVANGAFAANKP